MINTLILTCLLGLGAQAGPREDWSRMVRENAQQFQSVAGQPASELCQSDFRQEKKRLPRATGRHTEMLLGNTTLSENFLRKRKG